MTHVKICSIQTIDHGLVATTVGADFIGFNFVPGVRRQLEENTARSMIRQYRERRGSDASTLVGIFADQSLEEVNRVLDKCGLDMAQLSGREPISYAVRVNRPVIKAVHVLVGQPQHQVISTLERQLKELESEGVLPLLHPHIDGALGGTGATFDWAIAQELAPNHKFLMAGGLTPDNITNLVERVKPWGVDVSSGVETNGVKDPQKIQAFIRRAQLNES